MSVNGQSLGVVVPCYNETTQIVGVVNSMPGYVDKIILVDDKSTDDTLQIMNQLMKENPKVIVSSHDVNRGVGASIETGYRKALDVECDLIAVMAGDGQMNPDDLSKLTMPVAEGIADYAKANRLTLDFNWKDIPLIRKVGNFILSFLTRFASGYWKIGDSQTGYTVATSRLIAEIVRTPLYPRYGVPNDILIRCAISNARVVDVPTPPVYNVGEQSKLRPSKVAIPIFGILVRGFFKRMWVKYFVLQANPIPFAYISGISGLVAGFFWFIRLIANDTQVTTARLAVLLLLLFCSSIMLVLGVLLDVLFMPKNGTLRDFQDGKGSQGSMDIDRKFD